MIESSSQLAGKSMTSSNNGGRAAEGINPDFDWKKIARLVLTSRMMDHIEETELYPKKVMYQFSARGHDMSQVLLGSLLTHQHDAAGAYYRSRPLLITLGLEIEDALAGPLAMSGGFSDGRDIGVVCNFPNPGGCSVLPMSGDVGSQYTPIAGWAQSILYRQNVLKDSAYEGALGVVLGGEGSVATNGFWSSLTMATTLKLPMLFYIEDNGYAISVTSEKQTPGQNIADNLASFKNLMIIDGDGTDPADASVKLSETVDCVRSGQGPALIRLTVPRLSGHSGQDTQAYKPEGLVAEERASDPLLKLRSYLVPEVFTEKEWEALESEVEKDVRSALEAAMGRPAPDPATVTKHAFFDGEVQQQGGLATDGHSFPEESELPHPPEPTRTNMLTAIRKTLSYELKTNPKLLVFGEDVGPKGGVHAATMGLQEEFGEDRVFDTSLSEEGIIGRAVGMACSGLMPVAEIQFRKYADPAQEQLNNCGTIRWRTANRFAAPIVVRLPGGFAKCGDPWHSVCGEVQWTHAVGWQVAMPSNAEDAVGLLRSAMRSNNPTIFFEHRHMLDAPWARRPYPGDSFVVPFGKAKITAAGEEITLVSWGAMVERCEEAAKKSGKSVEVIDLRTLSPWDKETVLESVKKTRRCIVVHEDTIVAGFGAEVTSVIASEGFLNLDAPLERMATPQVPIPYNISLMDAVLPSVDGIAAKIVELVEY